MTLVIGLIMLIMISLAAVASYQMSKTSTEVVGNMQFQNEAVASADNVIQDALSRVSSFQTPLPAVQTASFDYNNDGNNDVQVQLQVPACVKVKPKLNAELNLTQIDPTTNKPLDAGCATQAILTGVEGASSGVSLCADTTWELTAVATDATTGASVSVTQGANVQIKTTDADASC